MKDFSMDYKVLIVEDDPMVAMINEQYICKNKCFSVAGSCRNGAEAMEFLKHTKVDLVILDVFMPYKDGIQTLKELREQKIDSDVIMVTAANDSRTLEETMHLGVIDYLIKPFAFERLLVALEKFITKKTALKEVTVLDQCSIDRLLSNSASPKQEAYPKGIQEKTLNMILDFLKENPGWHAGDMIAEKLAVSIVTVRHYMNYLIEHKQAQEDMNYGTGGRPSVLYKGL